MISSHASTWQGQVVRSQVHRARLLLTFSNGAFSMFLRNWLGGLRALAIQHFAVVALDAPTWSLLDALGLSRHRLHYGLGNASATTPLAVQHAAGWYDPSYRRLMGERPRHVLTILSYGAFDLLLTDVDVAWLRSPWTVLYDPSRSHCHIQAMAASGAASDTRWDEAIVVRQPHPQANCVSCVNAGFLFLRRVTPSGDARGARWRGGSAAIELMKRWARALRAVGEADHNQK